MTQQSLITRLKAVEKALAEVLAAERATNRPPSTVMEAEAKLDRIRAAAKQADAALSDLRELIKEAEEQTPDTYKYLVYMPLGEKSWVTADRIRDRPVLETKPLYTALGGNP